MFPNEVLGFGVDSNVVQNMDESFTKDVYHHMSGSAWFFGALQAYNLMVSNFSINYLQKIFQAKGSRESPPNLTSFKIPPKFM